MGFALLWSGLPALIGVLVALHRRQSIPMAVVLGLVLSWVGLLGLLIGVYLVRPEVRTGAATLVPQ
ncbi:MAG TPA: hypothetical protein VNE62_03580 [Actinomycetota bacterium]|nr:hypothetical protein [Actinomycetota bacterium]